MFDVAGPDGLEQQHHRKGLRLAKLSVRMLNFDSDSRSGGIDVVDEHLVENRHERAPM
jgi:hypothetical protein